MNPILAKAGRDSPQQTETMTPKMSSNAPPTAVSVPANALSPKWLVGRRFVAAELLIASLGSGLALHLDGLDGRLDLGRDRLGQRRVVERHREGLPVAHRPGE